MSDQKNFERPIISEVIQPSINAENTRAKPSHRNDHIGGRAHSDEEMLIEPFELLNRHQKGKP